MWSLMAACDVLVNLRYPTMGETSGSVIRALSLGKPLLVSDVGWFSELPDDVVLKVPVDELEVVTLAAALEFAAEHSGVLGSAARDYVEREHSLSSVADAYVAALEVAAGGDAVDDAVLWRIAEAAAEAGVTDMSLLAQRLREVGIGA
jgi:glycosyltransferase involved in cell wall biosynthesis